MQKFTRAFFAMFALAIWATLWPMSTAHAEKRVALVIGNSAYTQATPLANPRNDARDVAAALRRLNFEVIEGIDLDKAGMNMTIRKFSKALENADVALFYYAGHGLQVAGKNYLAPVNAKLSTMSDLDFDAVPLDLVLRQMERKKRTNIVFLDACRNNPLTANLARSMGASRSAAILGRGLARVDTGVGTLISYATQPGNVALDGNGRNSPFTTALLKHIETPALDIAELMITVRKDVLESSNGKQVPWENSSLTGQFYFNPKTVKTTARPETPRATIPTFVSRFDRRELDLAFWNSIKDSKDPDYYHAYLKKYPNGEFISLARKRIKTLAPQRLANKPPVNQPQVTEPGNIPPGTKMPPVGKVAHNNQPQGDLPSKPEHGAIQDNNARKKPIDALQPPDGNPPVNQHRLVHALQSELKRIGCYSGQIDGDWGPRSRAAMHRYNRATKQNHTTRLPVPATLKFLKKQRATVCRRIVRRRHLDNRWDHVRAPKRRHRRARRVRRPRDCVVDNSTPTVMEDQFARNPWRRVC